VIFQDGGCRHLGFLKIQNFNGWSAARGQLASPCTVPNFIKIGRTVAEIWRFNGFFFQNEGRLPSWIYWGPIDGLYRYAKFG